MSCNDRQATCTWRDESECVNCSLRWRLGCRQKTSEYFFHDFLARYDTDYVDILFLHNSDGQRDYDKLMKPRGLLDMALRFQQEVDRRMLTCAET